MIHPRPRDHVWPEDDLNIFLGCPVRVWDLGFVGLAGTTITNFQNFCEVFQHSREAGLWYCSDSANRDLEVTSVGLEEGPRLAGMPGQVSGGPGGLEGHQLSGRQDCRGMKVLFRCLKGCHMEEGNAVCVASEGRTGPRGGFCKGTDFHSK